MTQCLKESASERDPWEMRGLVLVLDDPDEGLRRLSGEPKIEDAEEEEVDAERGEVIRPQVSSAVASKHTGAPSLGHSAGGPVRLLMPVVVLVPLLASGGSCARSMRESGVTVVKCGEDWRRGAVRLVSLWKSWG